MTHDYRHIKIRLLVREHLWTVVISMLFLLVLRDSFLIYIIPALLVVSLIGQFTSKEKFLAGIAINDGSAELIYLTPNLRLHKEEIDLRRVSDAEVARAGFLIKYPLEFTIRYEGEWRSYYIIGKGTVKAIDTFFNAANISFQQ